MSGWRRDCLALRWLASMPARDNISGSITMEAQLSGTLGNPLLTLEGQLSGASALSVVAERVQLQVTGAVGSDAILDFALSSDLIHVADQPLTNVSLTGDYDGSAGLVRLADLSARQTDAPGRLQLAGEYFLASGLFETAGSINAWQLVPTTERPVDGSLDSQFTASRGVDALTVGSASLSVAGARWDSFALGPLVARVAADGVTAHVTVDAPRYAGSLDGDVSQAQSLDARFDLFVDGFDLARLNELVELPVTVSGTANLTAHAEGALASWRDLVATADVSASAVTVNDLPVEWRAPARLTLENRRMTLEALDLALQGIRLDASGVVSLENGFVIDDTAPMRLRLAGQLADAVSVATHFGFEEPVEVTGTGTIALDARVSGPLRTPEVIVDLEVAEGVLRVAGYPAMSNVMVEAHLEDGWLAVDEGRAEYQGARLTVTGGGPVALFGVTLGGPQQGDASLALRLSSLTTRSLVGVLPASVLAQMAGTLELSADIRASSLEPADFTGEIRLDRFLMAVSGLPLSQRVPTRLLLGEGELRVAEWSWEGGGASLEIAGGVTLADRQLDLTASGVLDLRLLTPFIRDAGLVAQGQLMTNLSFSGPVTDPVVDGDLMLTSGEVRLASPRVLASDLTGLARVTRSSMELVQLTGTLNGGTLSAEGDVVLTPSGEPDGQLRISVTGAALEIPEGLQSEMGVAVTLLLPGDLPRAPGLSGRIVVDRAAYREQLSAIAQVLEAVSSDGVLGARTAPGAFDLVTLDVEVVTDEDVLVDNNYGQLQIGADLRVIGTVGAPALSGRTEIREGGRLFLGRNVYSVTTGTIDFANPDIIEPNFNIVATTRAGGHDIQITIEGVPSDISVAPVSLTDPDLSQTDVQALLLTGRTFDDLSSSDAAVLSVQLLGNFSGEVLGVAGRAVGLDELRLGGVDTGRMRGDSATLATEADPTSRLTFGKGLGTNVDVTYSQSLIKGGAQTWILDYKPRPRIDFRLVSDDENLRAYSVRHDVQFGEVGSFGTGGVGGAGAGGAPRVVAVILDGQLEFAEGDVRSQLGLDAGDRFTFPAWLDDRDRLRSYYRGQGFLTARIDATRIVRDGGVTLTYMVTPGLPSEVRVTGVTLDDDLLAAVRNAWSELVSDVFLIDEVDTLVRASLVQGGVVPREREFDRSNKRRRSSVENQCSARPGSLRTACADRQRTR